ncbi:MAG: flagellar motor switch protein FliG [Desulfobacteraceae bacterium]|jgi:flagellar motor switch protein FliG|nr:flagellar motor switch protein FliG [Desulfobacteraceae bacterium]MDH3573080.1 flagellar motor switch protein FliG [Desulfobacteraceae bacterium]MDH3720086.1 flagellar motor switch protein FliG [Desulfobacteraceae bacterium]MDH3836565.1 flagellar motor switch protein FliG [Desulfobacteraceae bacterium]MDH3874118.1 flagellar motor switch protein FliG [Desulfobacteraceae bacterium]
MKLNADKLSGPQKAAILFLTMGEEYSTALFKQLDEASIKKIGKYMSEITHIPSDVLSTVMNEFLINFKSDGDVVISGEDFLKQIVNKSMDKESAREVFKVIGEKGTSVPFSDLAYIPVENLINIIQGEHPQTIALILSYLPYEKAAEVLKSFPEELKIDVALRIVQIGQVDVEIVNELDKVIKNELSKIGGATRKCDGIETLANILNQVDGITEESVLSHIENEDGDLADMVRQKMFVFEDLLQIENRHFRDILQNVDNQLLIKALKTTSDEMKDKVFSNLSERASEMLREDMEVMGPVKLSEVEEAQQEIIKVAKRLESEGRIVLSKGGDDVFV